MYGKEELEIDTQYLIGHSNRGLDRKEAEDFILSIIRQSNGKLGRKKVR